MREKDNRFYLGIIVLLYFLGLSLLIFITGSMLISAIKLIFGLIHYLFN